MPENVFNLKIFQGIDRSIVEKIVTSARERQFSQWDVLMNEGELSNGEGYIIKSGAVSISIQGNKVAELNAGDIVGEMALLSEEERSATVKALDEVEAIVLTLGDLIEMINNDENKINKEIIRRIEENLENEEAL